MYASTWDRSSHHAQTSRKARRFLFARYRGHAPRCCSRLSFTLLILVLGASQLATHPAAQLPAQQVSNQNAAGTARTPVTDQDISHRQPEAAPTSPAASATKAAAANELLQVEIENAGTDSAAPASASADNVNVDNEGTDNPSIDNPSIDNPSTDNPSTDNAGTNNAGTDNAGINSETNSLPQTKTKPEDQQKQKNAQPAVPAANATSSPAQPTATDSRIDFDKQIGPLLLRRCVECHAGLEPKGEY